MLRYIIGLSLVVLILLGTVIALSLEVYSGGAEDSVKTRQLELVDGDGVSRAMLTTISGGRPSLTMLDGEGQNRALLFLSDDGSPNLVLVDNGRLVLMDAAGQIRTAGRVDGNGNPFLTFHDATGNVIWSAPPTPAPAP